MTHMLIAVTAMFLQQTCGSIARALPAVLAPLIIAELHANAAWVGIYFSLTAFAGLIGQLGSGGFIIRHGAIRMSQIALLFTGAGLAVAVLGGAAGFVLSALIGNGVASVATPASSQLLGRWSVKRYAPFAFSIAQCAIPAGILLTGYLGPLTAQSFGWRDTMLASAALCWTVALMLQPLRGRLDTKSSARHPIRLSDLPTTITAVLAVRELRSLSFACFAFNGIQAVFVAYFVTYMTSQGHPLVAAGSRYSTVIAVALPGRILWAWVGGFYVAPHLVSGRVGLRHGCQHWADRHVYASLAVAGDRRGNNGGQRHGVVLARHHAVGSRASGAAGTSGRGDWWGAVIWPDRRAVQSRGLFVAARAVWRL